MAVESAGHNQHHVKVDGSEWITLSSCCFLRAYTPAMPFIQPQQPAASQPPNRSPHQCRHPWLPVPPLYTPTPTQMMVTVTNDPITVHTPALMLSLTPGTLPQDDSPNLNIQSRDLCDYVLISVKRSRMHVHVSVGTCKSILQFMRAEWVKVFSSLKRSFLKWFFSATALFVLLKAC